MTTTMRIQNKQVSLTIEQKAHLLHVFSDHPGLRENELAVTSGSQVNTAYAVRHDGKHAIYCPCRSVGRCAHKLAVDWKLEADRRMAYVELFHPNGEE